MAYYTDRFAQLPAAPPGTGTGEDDSDDDDYADEVSEPCFSGLLSPTPHPLTRRTPPRAQVSEAFFAEEHGGTPAAAAAAAAAAAGGPTAAHPLHRSGRYLLSTSLDVDLRLPYRSELRGLSESLSRCRALLKTSEPY